MQAEGSQLLMLHEVEDMTRLKKSCLYDLMKKGYLPLADPRGSTCRSMAAN